MIKRKVNSQLESKINVQEDVKLLFLASALTFLFLILSMVHRNF